MKGKFTLIAVLLLAIGGTAMAETQIARYPQLPSYPPLDETEVRLQQLEQIVKSLQSQTNSLRIENQTLRSDLSNMVAINDYMTLESVHGRPTVRFSAVNLQVVNGSGHNFSNGRGNILIGYDRLRPDIWEDLYPEECSLGNYIEKPITTQAECLAAGGAWGRNHKGGSHYLVVGDDHNYSGFAGIVSGQGSTSSSPYASVTGGLYNRATGFAAAISGGDTGLASGHLSSISGGYENEASGRESSVTGGNLNIASGVLANVIGGSKNQASGPLSTVTGGTSNTAAGAYSSISGGAGGVASGYSSSISGGVDREMPHSYGWTGGTY